MLYPEHVLVVVAGTLSGGVEKLALWPRERATVDDRNGTCGTGSTWTECAILDAFIVPEDVLVPWVLTLAWLVFLSMPTVLLRSRHKEAGLASLAWVFVQYFVLVTCCVMGTDHPFIAYAMTLHSCVRLLTRVRVTSKMVGGRSWWSLRYLGICALLLWIVVCGSPVSIVRWSRGGPWDQSLSCAYLAHLAGSLVPDLILFFLEVFLQIGYSFCRSDAE